MLGEKIHSTKMSHPVSITCRVDSRFHCISLRTHDEMEVVILHVIGEIVTDDGWEDEAHGSGVFALERVVGGGLFVGMGISEMINQDLSRQEVFVSILVGDVVRDCKLFVAVEPENVEVASAILESAEEGLDCMDGV